MGDLILPTLDSFLGKSPPVFWIGSGIGAGVGEEGVAEVGKVGALDDETVVLELLD